MSTEEKHVGVVQQFVYYVLTVLRRKTITTNYQNEKVFMSGLTLNIISP